MKTELRWSATLGMDANGLWVWRGMWALAAFSVGWTVWGHWPWDSGQWWAFSSVGLLAIGWFWSPAAWFLPGDLVIHDDRAHWRGQSGRVAWVWLGEHLMGLMFTPDEGRPTAIWLTARRVGTVAWWQLRRSLALHPPTARASTKSR